MIKQYKNSKASRSKRNRHTGIVNAFKQRILEKGKRFDLPDRTWFAYNMYPGKSDNHITIVRLR